MIVSEPSSMAYKPEESACHSELIQFLDHSQALLTSQAILPSLTAVFHKLHELRRELNSTEWEEHIAVCRHHPVCGLLHQDPFTYRAFSKPRGYAGDAVMLDYIYGREEHWPPPPATPLGRQIFDYTTRAPASEGVRARRGFVADLIDRIADEERRPHVLSIAAGHFREADLSAAIKRRRIGRLVTLDADADSMQAVSSAYGRYGVETVPAPLRRLLAGKLPLGTFDLVYSLGLFDYLSDNVGRRLVTHAFRMLRPGGRLVVANFLPGIRDVGYMEAFMDWKLIYRTRQDMVALTTEIPENDIRDLALFSEENRNIIFLQLRRV